VVLGSSSRRLDVGRSTRLATDTQRAALRAVHDSCVVGACDMPFDHCEIHHIEWWRNGGRSDIDNLVPLCSKHHHLVHHSLWNLVVDAHRVGQLVQVGESVLRKAGRGPFMKSEPRGPTPTRRLKAPALVGSIPSGPTTSAVVPMRC
jgi:hypothetical protein